MKKKLIVTVIALVLVLSTALALTACSVLPFISKNEERDMNQVVATITYGDRVKTITKSQIADSFNSYGYYYMAYQSMSADDVFNMLAETLSNSALYTLFLIDEYNKELTNDGVKLSYSTKGMKSVTVDERTKEIEELLYYVDNVELRKSIDTTNKSFSDAFDSNVKEIEQDRELANIVIDENVTEREQTDKPTNATLKSIEVKSNGMFAVTVDKDGNLGNNVKGEVASHLLAYYVDATFDTNDITVIATFADKDDATKLTAWEVPYTEYTVDGFDSKSAAEAQKLTIKYGKKSASINVNIVAKDTARTAKPEAEEDEEEKYTEIDTDTTGYAAYLVTLNDQKYFVSMDKKTDMTTDEKDAYSDLKKTLEKNYRTYNYYLLQNYETALNDAYKNKLYEDYIAANPTKLDELVAVKYKELLQKDLESYAADSGAFKSKLDSDVSEMINYEEGGYYYVKHILLSFSDEQKQLVTDFKNLKIASEEEITEYRNGLINAIDGEGGIKVNVSNTEFKGGTTSSDSSSSSSSTTAVCEDENCTCVACSNYIAPKDDNKNTINNGHVCYDEDCPCLLCVNNMYTEKDVAWTEIYNRIQTELQGINTSTADESERLTKLIDAIDNWSYLVNDDTGSFAKIDAKTPGYLMVPVGEKSGMVAEFEELAEKLYADYKAGVQTSESIASCQYCITEYGIHIMFFIGEAVDTSVAVTDVPTVDAALDGGYAISEVDNIDGYVVGLNHVVDVNEGTTLGEKLSETVKSNLLSELTIGKKKEFFTKSYDGNVTFNKKVYSDLVENAEKMMNQQ